MKKWTAMLLLCAVLLGLTACGGKETGKSVDLEALYAQCVQSMPDMIVLDETTRENFYGIEAGDCAQVITAICADGMVTDEIWLIEAKDAGTLENLKALAEGRMQAKADETISYAPDQYAVVEKGRILTQGKYLALVVTPEVETVAAAIEAAIQ